MTGLTEMKRINSFNETQVGSETAEDGRNRATCCGRDVKSLDDLDA